MKKIIAVLIVLLVMVASLPNAAAVWFDMPYTYDNSFWVALETTETVGTAQLEEMLGVETCYLLDKQTREGKITYQVIVMNGQVPVETDMERVKALDGVVQVRRNQFAFDYGQGESYITLNQNHVEIPVGGTATLTVAEAHLFFGLIDYRVVGAAMTVDHQALPYETFCEVIGDLKTQHNLEELNPYALYEEDFFVEEWELFPMISFSNKYEDRNTESPIGQYVFDTDSANEMACLQAVEKLAEIPEITDLRVVYDIAPGGSPSVEEWTVDDEKVVTLTTDRDKGTFRTATLQGNRAGQTVVHVIHGNTGGFCYAQCDVTVYRLGDLNLDEKIDAKDALQVLKYAVQKVEFTSLQALSAEVDGVEGIGARDALEILKYTVQKIDKFPIEESAVTPTDLTK